MIHEHRGGEENMPPKKNRRKKAFAIAASVVVLLAALIMIFGKMIFYAAAPEMYVGYLLSNTFSGIEKELEKSGGELVGIEPAEDDYTVSLGYYDENQVGGEFKLAVSNSGREARFLSVKHGENETVSEIKAYTNDAEAGASISGVTDGFVTLSSKNFGKEWNDSELADLYLVDRDADLSFSALKNRLFGGSLEEDSRKEIYKITLRLLKNSELGKREDAKINIDGKDVKAKQIEVKISENMLRAYLTDVANVIEKDKVMAAKSGNSAKDTAKKIRKTADKLEGDVFVTLIEYKSKVVGIRAVIAGEGSRMECAVNFKSKTLINDIEIIFESNSGENTTRAVVRSHGEHIPKKGVFSDDTTIEISFNSGTERDLKIINSLKLDFKDQKVSGSLTGTYGGREILNADYSGSCRDDSGLRVELNRVTVTTKDGTATARAFFEVKEGADKLFEVGSKTKLLNIKKED